MTWRREMFGSLVNVTFCARERRAVPRVLKILFDNILCIVWVPLWVVVMVFVMAEEPFGLFTTCTISLFVALILMRGTDTVLSRMV